MSTDLIKEGYVKDLTGNEVIKNLGLTSGDMGDVSYEGNGMHTLLILNPGECSTT